jgi:hypothetical protein
VLNIKCNELTIYYSITIRFVNFNFRNYRFRIKRGRVKRCFALL